MALNNKTVLSTFKEGTQIYDIVNAIRTEGSPEYNAYVPLANAENVAQLRDAFKSNKQMMNEFVGALINKVSKTILTKLAVRQVLEQFKRGNEEFGDTIEEIHVNLAKEHVFDAVRAESEVFKREMPDVQAFYHKRNRKGFYKQTINDAEVVRAFNSWNGVTSLLTKIVDSMYNGNRNDEYKYMKLIIESAFAAGAFHIVPVGDIGTTDGLKHFVEKAREYSLLTQDVNHFNPTGVDNTSIGESQYVILPAKTEAKMDVNLLASAFNMDRTDFLGRRVGINSFSNGNIAAVMIDRDFYVVFDHLFELRSMPNPENLCTNYWLHVHQTLSYSPFHTAIAFVTGEVNPITSIVLNPPVSVIGKEGVTLSAHAKVPDGLEQPDLSTIVYTSNAGDQVTLVPDGDLVLVKPSGGAIPGSMITITGTFTDADLKEYKATAQVQVSNALALV